MHKNKEVVYKHPDYIGDKIATEDGSTTLVEMLFNIAKKHENKDFLGTIQNGTEKIEYETFGEVCKKMTKLGKSLREIVNEENKNKAKNDDKEIIGIYSVNRAEWIIAEYAIYISNATNCPLYSTFGAESIMHIFSETEMQFCFVSGQKAESLYKDIISFDKFNLKAIICFDTISDDLYRKYELQNIKVLYYKDLHSVANKNEDCQNNNDSFDLPSDLPKKEDLATICYTSGTSGKPKGVLLTHTNFITATIGFMSASDEHAVFDIKKDDVYISYLPLAHVMERVCVTMIIAHVAKIVFYRGNPKILQQDIKIIKPTVFVGVPRVFNVFKQKIEEVINSKPFFVRWLINTAIKYKIKQQSKGIYTNYVLDTLIFNKVKNQFGGRIRGSLNGSAPLSKSVAEYLQAVLCTRIFQGYGQTEGTAANIIMSKGDYTNDGVGIPCTSNLVKLIPIENYSGNKGEICLKGNNITKGYYKREDLNSSTFSDGWLLTGDIGAYEDGKFKIIGRRKEIFKTSLGEYIIPEKIEDVYKKECIDDIVITGRSHGDYIVALVVCKNDNVQEDEILNKIQSIGEKACKDGKILKYEIPKKIHVLRHDFDFYGEMHTPTMKKKRSKIECYFEKEIDLLYDK